MGSIVNELKYKHLFQPIQLGNVWFRNRIFAPPQDYPGLTSEKFLTEEAVYFYERKALGGFASVCVGDAMINCKVGQWASHPYQMLGNNAMGKVSLTRVSAAIARHGAVPAIELNRAGVIGMIPEGQGFIYGVSDGITSEGVEIRAMTEEQIEDMIAAYAVGAGFARQCGYAMITIHGAHGWQITQFISPRNNKRKDRWGGSLENRMRFPLAVIEAVRKRIGRAVPIEFRMSATEALDDGYGIEEGIRIAQALDGKVDMINVSCGNHEDDRAFMVMAGSQFTPDGHNMKYAAEIKKRVKTPVSTVGNYTDPDMMEEVIASGQADVVHLGRQSLADPDFPLKARMGLEEEINPCLRCFNCFSYSGVGGVFYCATNPEIGHEQDVLQAAPPFYKKTVLVVGGGVAGMQAALKAFQRGHQVILCEKSDRLGGTLLCEERVPFKSGLSRYLKRQAARVMRSPIEVHLKTEVTPEVAKSFKPHVIIAALGSRPVIPNIKGIKGKNVVGAMEAYLRPEVVGKKAAIIGGGLVGLELGLFLAREGRNVTVTEMLDTTIASPPPVEGVSNRMGGFTWMTLGHPLYHGIAIRLEAEQLSNLKICVSTKGVQVSDKGLVVEDANGLRTIEADTVIYAVGQQPLREEAQALAACAPEFHQIGDCVAPKTVFEATSVAYQIATDIGRF